MFTLTLSHNALKALTLVVSNDANRSHLHSICVDTTTPGRVHLVATDGHRMLVVGDALLFGDATPGQYLLPASEIKRAKRLGTDRYPRPTIIEIDPHARTYKLSAAETLAGSLLDETFPPWRKVLPTRRDFSKPGKCAFFDFNYLGDFGRIAELLGCRYPYILHNGDKAATVYLGADAFGVLMPIREPHVPVSFVDWLEPKGLESKAA